MNNNVVRRIVAAYYDLGILEEKDLEKIPLDYKLDTITKESIIVEEAMDEVVESVESIEENEKMKEKVLW